MSHPAKSPGHYSVANPPALISPNPFNSSFEKHSRADELTAMTTPVPVSRSTVPHRWRYAARLLGILILALTGALLAERWRGQYALRSWMEQRAELGESLVRPRAAGKSPLGPMIDRDAFHPRSDRTDQTTREAGRGVLPSIGREHPQCLS